MPDPLTEIQKEQATLYVLGVLDFNELRNFKAELKSNSSLGKYVEELQQTLELTEPLKDISVDATWLQGQRNLLRVTIAKLSPGTDLIRSAGDRLRLIFDTLFIPQKSSLAIATYALLAFLAGRFLIPNPTTSSDSKGVDVRELIQSGLLSQADIQLDANRQHPIHVAVDTRQKVELSGDVNDEQIRELISYLLLNDKNPGNRMKAADLVEEMNPDQEVKMVLVSSALSDPNPGIRLRSMRLLQSYSVDPLLINACQKILMEDTNEAVRMEAISILAKKPSRKLLPILRLVTATESNSFIRNQARELLFKLNDSMNPLPVGDIQ
ncbi:MAG: HEAT repeat domain-containing protein [FCB group bacterium]|nr:HEAT repeat domain-containing protein [FCB group bacterium]